MAEKKAKPLPGVVDFARAANAKGVTLVYISNRAVHLKEATLANLRSAGLPVADDSVFLGWARCWKAASRMVGKGLPAPAGGREVPRADAVRRPTG